MKTKYLLILLAIPLFLHAEIRPETEQSPKWAIGVTLWNNMYYDSPEARFAVHPFELSVQYRVLEHHSISLNVPVIHQRYEPVFSDWSSETFNTLDDYAAYINSNEANSNTHVYIDNYITSLYGLSVGYQYDYPLLKRISLIGGFDFAYYYNRTDYDYYQTVFTPDTEIKQLLSDGLYNIDTDRNLSVFQPLIGLQWKCSSHLLFSAQFCYAMKFYQDKETKTFYSKNDPTTSASQRSYLTSQWVYAFRLYYLF